MTGAPAGSTGILGGSFDPVHNAHLAMARTALEALSLSKILWIPSGTPPHRAGPVAGATDRAAMVRLAIEDEPRFELDERELRKSAPGYTIETLEALRAELGPQAGLVLLIGADQYEKLDTWHRWRELSAFARIAVFARPDHAIVDTQDITVVPMQPLAISSTRIRSRLAAGEPVDGLVPQKVLDYIRSHRLYSGEHKSR